MSLLYLLVHDGVRDADAAVYAEGEGHFLVHQIKVWITNFIYQLTYTYYASLFAYWETKD